ncbi:glycine cleavage system H protein-like [Glandiceps talaboti]
MASVVRLGFQRAACFSSRCLITRQTNLRSLPQLAKYCDVAFKAPADRRYTEKHEWVKLDGDIGTVGITSYAQDSLGEVVYVGLPDIGSAFDVDDEFGTVESVKAASELYCPVAGEVVEVNSALEDEPSLINNSPYDDGWVMKLKLDAPEQLKDLKDAEEYKKFVEDAL